MKKIFSLVVLFAAVAMVGCCGTGNKKADEKAATPCEQCEATPAECPAATAEAPAEAPVEAPAEAPAK